MRNAQPPRTTASERLDRGIALAERRSRPAAEEEIANLGLNGHSYAVVAEQAPTPSWVFPEPFTFDEMQAANLTPAEVVQSFLWADLGLLVGSGGTGKTVWLMHMAVCIALGRAFFGRPILRPGRVLFVTGEDPGEVMLATLRQVGRAMGLTREEFEIALDGVRISDVTGGGSKLSIVERDVVVPSLLPDWIAEQSQGMDVRTVIFDPTVSFSAGETRVNDSEQGLIESGRRIRNQLRCAVIFSHHTGQGPARARDFGMYAARNGSALPDGCRMEWVMHRADPALWLQLTGRHVESPRYAIEMAVARCQYAPPSEQHLYFEREGHAIECVTPMKREPMNSPSADAVARQVWQLLDSELAQGRWHSQNTLEEVARKAGIGRTALRSAVHQLESEARVADWFRPGSEGWTPSTRPYLHPLGTSAPKEHWGAPRSPSQGERTAPPDVSSAPAQGLKSLRK